MCVPVSVATKSAVSSGTVGYLSSIMPQIIGMVVLAVTFVWNFVSNRAESPNNS